MQKPDIILEIAFGTAPVKFDENGRWLSHGVIHKDSRIWEKYHWRDEEDIVRCESAGRGQTCRLFIPQSFADYFCESGKWLNYFQIERMLLPWNRILLHASAVIYQGRSYLFSAPSGGGKSTHASLWQKYYDAKLLNGDKVIVNVTGEGCVAYGSPVAGSSGIYCNDSAPVEAIIMLHKGEYNRIAPLSERTGFLSIYSEAVKSTWDSEFNACLLENIEIMQKQIPVLSLECRPEKAAVECILQYQREKIK